MNVSVLSNLSELWRSRRVRAFSRLHGLSSCIELGMQTASPDALHWTYPRTPFAGQTTSRLSWRHTFWFFWYTLRSWWFEACLLLPFLEHWGRKAQVATRYEWVGIWASWIGWNPHFSWYSKTLSCEARYHQFQIDAFQAGSFHAYICKSPRGFCYC